MSSNPSNLRSYFELLRLPNVFTAVADVLAGAWLAHWLAAPQSPMPWGAVAVLIAASSCLYLGGMALNDYFDRKQDAQERPTRPIPSGRVSVTAARWLGIEFLILGVAFGCVASFLIGDWRGGAIAAGLAALVVLYDAVLKPTPAGPLAMGGCRTLNMLLGMSCVAAAWGTVHFAVAGGLGVYIVGVTWFARTEARQSTRWQLVASTVILVLGIAILAYYPRLLSDDVLGRSVLAGKLHFWYLFLAVVAAQIAWRTLRAALDPTPANVQIAVKLCIISIIALDATVCFVVGPIAALSVIALAAPMLFLGRFFYST